MQRQRLRTKQYKTGASRRLGSKIVLFPLVTGSHGLPISREYNSSHGALLRDPDRLESLGESFQIYFHWPGYTYPLHEYVEVSRRTRSEVAAQCLKALEFYISSLRRSPCGKGMPYNENYRFFLVGLEEVDFDVWELLIEYSP